MKKSNKMVIIIGTMCLVSGTVLGGIGTTIKAQLTKTNISKDCKNIAQNVDTIFYNNDYYLSTKTLGNITGNNVTCSNGVISIKSNDITTDISLEKYKEDYLRLVLVDANPVSDVETLYTIRDLGNNRWIEFAFLCKEDSTKYQNIYNNMITPEGKQMAKKYQELSYVLYEEIINLHNNNSNVSIVEKSFTKINNKLVELKDARNAFENAINPQVTK